MSLTAIGHLGKLMRCFHFDVLHVQSAPLRRTHTLTTKWTAASPLRYVCVDARRRELYYLLYFCIESTHVVTRSAKYPPTLITFPMPIPLFSFRLHIRANDGHYATIAGCNSPPHALPLVLSLSLERIAGGGGCCSVFTVD